MIKCKNEGRKWLIGKMIEALGLSQNYDINELTDEDCDEVMSIIKELTELAEIDKH